MVLCSLIGLVGRNVDQATQSIQLKFNDYE